jgi:tetratricopeptide (TPR) repeat protein
MILRIILVLLILFPSVANAMDSQVFQEMIDKINNNDFVVVENFLEKNRDTYKQDPEYYVILLNYSFSKGVQSRIVVAKGTPENGDLQLKDSTTGEAAGFIGNREVYDNKIILEGIQRTKEALKHFNDRLDIHLGIAYISAETKHWEILGQQLLVILESSRIVNNKWRWGPINSIKGDPKDFMLDNVQSKISNLFRVGSKETDQIVEAVSKAMIKAYPKVIYGYSDLGVLYLAQKRYDLAENFLNQAIAIDPNDEIVIGNLKLLREKKK